VFSPGVVQGLADAIKAFPGPGAGFEAPGATGDSISCDAGKTVDWMPFEAGAEVAVFGLTGAVVEQGEILWTPPHGGRYTAIAVASTKNGWAWRSEEFVCE
jgi:hypothetical protein